MSLQVALGLSILLIYLGLFVVIGDALDLEEYSQIGYSLIGVHLAGTVLSLVSHVSGFLFWMRPASPAVLLISELFFLAGWGICTVDEERWYFKAVVWVTALQSSVIFTVSTLLSTR